MVTGRRWFQKPLYQSRIKLCLCEFYRGEKMWRGSAWYRTSQSWRCRRSIGLYGVATALCGDVAGVGGAFVGKCRRSITRVIG
jgi:hypothetical protein